MGCNNLLCVLSMVVPSYITKDKFALIAVNVAIYTTQSEHIVDRRCPRCHVIEINEDPKIVYGLARKYEKLYPDYDFYVDLVDNPFLLRDAISSTNG